MEGFPFNSSTLADCKLADFGAVKMLDDGGLAWFLASFSISIRIGFTFSACFLCSFLRILALVMQVLSPHGPVVLWPVRPLSSLFSSHWSSSFGSGACAGSGGVMVLWLPKSLGALLRGVPNFSELFRG